MLKPGLIFEYMDPQGKAEMAIITGTPGNDDLAGTAADDVLDGGAGQDRMRGGAGNDTYYVDSVYLDRSIERPGEGMDTVIASVGHSLAHSAPWVENLTLTGNARNAIGNDLDNILTGNAKDNFLVGGRGNNVLIGGGGRDRFYLSGDTDRILGTGSIVVSYAHVVLASGEFRRVDLLGVFDQDFLMDEVAPVPEPSPPLKWSGATVTATSGFNHHIRTGNSMDIIRSGGGNDLLEGQGGRDQLFAGAGNDVLRGGDGADRLFGGGGTDRFEGGTGDDHFFDVDLDDTVIELSGEGVDTVYSLGDYQLGDELENLEIGGLSGAGNALANSIRGNGLDNHLQGLAGNDLLYGESGNDSLEGGEGGDELWGGAGRDVLSGGNGKDLLFGGGQDDALLGGAGVDTQRGGVGDDVYSLSRGFGKDLLIEEAGTDVVRFLDDGGTISREQLWFRRTGKGDTDPDLEIRIIGAGDRIIIRDWYQDASKRVESIRTASGDVLSSENVELLVQAMAAINPPKFGATSLSESQLAALEPVIAAAWS